MFWQAAELKLLKFEAADATCSAKGPRDDLRGNIDTAVSLNRETSNYYNPEYGGPRKEFR